MTRSERLEMCTAAVVGIGIGWMLSHAMHLPWWAAIPLCTLIAGAWYRPKEVFTKVRDELAPWATRDFTKDAMRFAFLATYWIAYVILGWIVAMTSFGILMAFVMMLDGTLAREPGGAIFLCAFIGTLFGAMTLLLGIVSGMWIRDTQKKPRSYKKPMWGMPIMRRLSRSLMPSRNWFIRGWHRSFWWRMACVTWRIPIAQVLGIWMIVILLIDASLTVAIAAATTRRMAVMTSAFIGASVGTIVEFYNPGYSGFSVVIGMLTGGCVGYFWYPVAAILKRTRWDRSAEPTMGGIF